MEAQDKLSNSKLVSTMDVDKIFNPTSITPNNQKGDIERVQASVQAASNNTTLSSPDNIKKKTVILLNTDESISCTTNSLPRSKTSKPNRVLTMNMSDTQGLSPAASSHSPVPRAKNDSLQKPRQAPCKSAKDSSMRAASSGKIQSSAYATQRTYQQ